MRRAALAAAVTRDLLRRDEDHGTELRDLKRVAEGGGVPGRPISITMDWDTGKGLGLGAPIMRP